MYISILRMVVKEAIPDSADCISSTINAAPNYKDLLFRVPVL